MNDQHFLADIAWNDEDWPMRKAALEHVNDQRLLTEVLAELKQRREELQAEYSDTPSRLVIQHPIVSRSSALDYSYARMIDIETIDRCEDEEVDNPRYAELTRGIFGISDDIEHVERLLKAASSE